MWNMRNSQQSTVQEPRAWGQNCRCKFLRTQRSWDRGNSRITGRKNGKQHRYSRILRESFLLMFCLKRKIWEQPTNTISQLSASFINTRGWHFWSANILDIYCLWSGNQKDKKLMLIFLHSPVIILHFLIWTSLVEH